MCQWMNDTFGIERVVDAPAGRVKPLQGLPYRGTKTQGALRDPGLWCRTALPFKNGVAVHALPKPGARDAQTIANGVAVHGPKPAIYHAANARERESIKLKLLETIAEDLLKHRPGRYEPRVVKRRPKAYPAMKCPRQEYRDEFAASQLS